MPWQQGTHGIPGINPYPPMPTLHTSVPSITAWQVPIGPRVAVLCHMYKVACRRLITL